MASVWLGQNEDICPSIKKSMVRAAQEYRASKMSYLPVVCLRNRALIPN